MESTIDTARKELVRRVKRDIRIEGEITVAAFDFYVASVAEQYGVEPSDIESAAVAVLPSC